MANNDDDDVRPHLNLRQFWYETFNDKFETFGDSWTLEPTNTNMEGPAWNQSHDKAKVKFKCSSCGCSWTSMNGVVVFWFKLQEKTGSLRFKLFGQKCLDCPEDFQAARWYKEEVEKVLSNVHQKIGEKYYRYPNREEDRSQRGGRPRKPHNSQHCEACRMGVCPQSRRRGR